jgi:hypothetical protein
LVNFVYLDYAPNPYILILYLSKLKSVTLLITNEDSPYEFGMLVSLLFERNPKLVGLGGDLKLIQNLSDEFTANYIKRLKVIQRT